MKILNKLNRLKFLRYAGILVILATVLIFASMRSNKDNTKPIASTSPKTTKTASPSTTQDVSTGYECKLTGKEGKTLTSDKKGFSLCIPDGWTVGTLKGGDYVFAGQPLATQEADIEYAKNKDVFVDMYDSASSDDPYRFAVQQAADTDLGVVLTGGEQQSEFKLTSGVTGTRYYKQYPLEKRDNRAYFPGEKAYLYAFKKNNKVTFVVYNIFQKNEFTEGTIKQDDKDRLSLVEDVIKTLQLQ